MSDIGALLAEHVAVYDYDVSYVGPAACACGYETEGHNEDRIDDWAAHAAAVLASVAQ